MLQIPQQQILHQTRSPCSRLKGRSNETPRPQVPTQIYWIIRDGNKESLFPCQNLRTMRKNPRLSMGDLYTGDKSQSGSKLDFKSLLRKLSISSQTKVYETVPPAFRILSRAFSVTLRAQTVILGMSKILMSLVMVPTTTATLSAFPAFFMLRARREMERGGRLILLMNSLLRMILLNLASDLLAKNLYSLTNNLK